MPDFLLYLFLSLIGLQLVYFLIFSRLLFTSKKKHHQVSEEGISVIVCTHFELDNLQKLIPALKNQTYPNYEVIIVNDRSQDGTYDYLYDLCNEDSRFRRVQIDEVPHHLNAKKYAITLGVKAAANDRLLFCDADCVPNSENWIKEISTSFDLDTDFVIGYSHYKKTSGLLNAFIRFETVFTGIQYLNMALWKLPYMGVGRNLAYRKSVFNENKGFKGFYHQVGGDDDLFVQRYAKGKATEVVFGSESITISEPKEKLFDYFYQKIRHLHVGKSYSLSWKLFLGVFMFSYLSFWPLTLSIITQNYPIEIIIGCISARILVIFSIIYFSSKKLGGRLSLAEIFIGDFLFLFYYISSGFKALSSKHISWKKPNSSQKKPLKTLD
ncbi:MAG: glycosyltransferase [Cyclobacteriaceae bacterium]|nr:glycosyltransferase [Cyclobacteriaceae bacterium]MCH8515590.1 glycosyltransferase [Cyclobacteriaceae bacterium]